MTIVDTSVWIDHLRREEPRLVALLEADEVLAHPWVIGEIALGSLGRRRSEVLLDLNRLPRGAVVADDEVHAMIEGRDLAGRGIGWVDAQVLASALVCGARLWTSDRALAQAARELGLGG